MRSNRRGWTLMEMVWVTSLVLTLTVATAVFVVSRTRVDAYEQKALQMLNRLAAGMEDYFWTTTQPHRYPQDFNELATSQVAYVLDPLRLTPPTVTGDLYVYALQPSLSGGVPMGYTVTATPDAALVGAKTFYVSNSQIGAPWGLTSGVPPQVWGTPPSGWVPPASPPVVVSPGGPIHRQRGALTPVCDPTIDPSCGDGGN